MQISKITIGGLLVLCMCVNSTAASTTYEFEMTLCESFKVSETDDWSVDVDRYLMLRFADVKITSKRGYDFHMKLYFKADTEDLSQFNTPEKIAQGVRISSEKYLPYILEGEIHLEPVPLNGTYGYLTVITDAELAQKRTIPPGEYRYMTRGMYRTSDDTALGFSIMTNDVSSDRYRELLEYVYGFLKKPSDRQRAGLAQKPCEVSE
jgi:hypothetical protein